MLADFTARVSVFMIKFYGIKNGSLLLLYCLEFLSMLIKQKIQNEFSTRLVGYYIFAA